MTERHDGRAHDEDAAAARGPVTLSELMAIPRGRWRWLLAFALAGVAATLAYLTVLPAEYTASAVVTVRPVVLDPFSYPGPGADRAVNMNVEHSLATGQRVVRAVAAETGDPQASVRDRLAVEVPVGGQLLRFSYGAGTGARAIEGVNTAARTYLAARHDSYARQRSAQLRSYDQSLDSLRKKEKAAQQQVRKQAAQAADASQVTGEQQLRALNDQVTALAGQRAQIAAVDLTPGVITAPARRPVPSNRDHAAMYLVAGLLGGVLLGAVAAFVRESGDRRVRRAADATAATGAPLVGTVRQGRRVPLRARRADVAYLALAVLDLGAHPPRRPVMMISSGTGEGRVELSADLAVALAEHGHHVHLGDVLGAGDRLHSRVLATVSARWGNGQQGAPPSTVLDSTHLPPATAGPDALADTAQLPAITVPANGNGRATVTVAGAGPRRVVTGANGSEGKQTLTRTPVPVVAVGEGSVAVGAAEPAEDARLVVLDAPPAGSDARGARALDEGTAILVAALGRTRIVDLRRVADRLRAAGHRPAGVVLVGGRRD